MSFDPYKLTIAEFCTQLESEIALSFAEKTAREVLELRDRILGDGSLADAILEYEVQQRQDLIAKISLAHPTALPQDTTIGFGSSSEVGAINASAHISCG